MQLLFRIGFTILLLTTLGLFSSVASNVTGTVEITAPVTYAAVRGLVEVRGTALLTSAAPNSFDYYRLEYSRVDDSGQFIFEGEKLGTIPVADGLLDMWNTDLVPNGTYVIRLTVASRTGATQETSVSVLVSNDIPVLNRGTAQQAMLALPAQPANG